VHLLVATGGGQLAIEEVQLEEKSACPSKNVFADHAIQRGANFSRLSVALTSRGRMCKRKCEGGSTDARKIHNRDVEGLSPEVQELGQGGANDQLGTLN